MNILVAFNSNFKKPALTMLNSLVSYNFEKISLYLLYGKDLDEKSLQSVISYTNNLQNVILHPIKVTENILSLIPLNGWSIEACYRIIAYKLLPSNIDRILWLDADIIVKASLHDFYYQNFDGNSLSACIDSSNTSMSSKFRLGIPQEYPYFNSGVILFNLLQLRKNFNNVLLSDYLIKHKELIIFPDQDVLNGLFFDKTKIDYSNKYNYIIASSTKLKKADYKFIDEEVTILHFCGGIKPWNSRYKNRCWKYFWVFGKNIYGRRYYFIFLLKRPFALIYGEAIYYIKIVKSFLLNLMRRNNNND